jgi:hypothetical protein
VATKSSWVPPFIRLHRMSGNPSSPVFPLQKNCQAPSPCAKLQPTQTKPLPPREIFQRIADELWSNTYNLNRTQFRAFRREPECSNPPTRSAATPRPTAASPVARPAAGLIQPTRILYKVRIEPLYMGHFRPKSQGGRGRGAPHRFPSSRSDTILPAGVAPCERVDKHR